MRKIETYYLIDFENVSMGGLENMRKLKKKDHIIIFYTDNVSEKTIKKALASPHGEARIETMKVPAGKQSEDMHIVSFLGYLAGKYGAGCSVVIVSKDKDFDNLVKFWRQKSGMTISQRASVLENKVKQTQKQQIEQAKKVSEEKKEQVKEENAEFSISSVRKAAKIIAKRSVNSYGLPYPEATTESIAKSVSAGLKRKQGEREDIIQISLISKFGEKYGKTIYESLDKELINGFRNVILVTEDNFEHLYRYTENLSGKSRDGNFYAWDWDNYHELVHDSDKQAILRTVKLGASYKAACNKVYYISGYMIFGNVDDIISRGYCFKKDNMSETKF